MNRLILDVEKDLAALSFVRANTDADRTVGCSIVFFGGQELTTDDGW